MKIDELLQQAASVARANAYCPYSDYPVGCAIESSSGRIYEGCNVENVSYSATICAERVALGKMVVAGDRSIRRILVETQDGGSPCGVCLQALSEFVDDPGVVEVLLVNEAGEAAQYTFRELFPHAFSSFAVKRTERS